VNVERTDGDVDHYPDAIGYRTSHDELVIMADTHGGSFACYAKGTWIRVFYPPVDAE
jgi:hypothetical protein